VISIAYIDEGGAGGEKKGERMERQEGYEAPDHAFFCYDPAKVVGCYSFFYAILPSSKSITVAFSMYCRQNFLKSSCTGSVSR
jgi:hypothetical protein